MWASGRTPPARFPSACTPPLLGSLIHPGPRSRGRFRSGKSVIWVVRALGLWQFLEVDSIREPIHRRELAKMRDAFKEPHHAPELNAAIVSAREAVRAFFSGRGARRQMRPSARILYASAIGDAVACESSSSFLKPPPTMSTSHGAQKTDASVDFSKQPQYELGALA